MHSEATCADCGKTRKLNSGRRHKPARCLACATKRAAAIWNPYSGKKPITKARRYAPAFIDSLLRTNKP